MERPALPVTQEFFDKQSSAWRSEQDGLQSKIQDIQKATPARIDQAAETLRLTSRASELFMQQPAAEQRRLLQTMVERTWQDGGLRTTLFEPFEVLRHSNQESYRKEKENGGSGRDLKIWLLQVGLETRRLTAEPLVAASRCKHDT